MRSTRSKLEEELNERLVSKTSLPEVARTASTSFLAHGGSTHQSQRQSKHIGEENERKEGALRETIESYRRTKSMLKDLTKNLNKSSKLLIDADERNSVNRDILEAQKTVESSNAQWKDMPFDQGTAK